jgi:transcriptional regulator with XRE-family HTH domain
MINIEILNQAKDEQKLTDAEIAKRANLGRTRVNQILNGHVTDLKHSTLEAIAAALNVPIESVITGGSQ